MIEYRWTEIPTNVLFFSFITQLLKKLILETFSIISASWNLVLYVISSKKISQFPKSHDII